MLDVVPLLPATVRAVTVRPASHPTGLALAQWLQSRTSCVRSLAPPHTSLC